LLTKSYKIAITHHFAHYTLVVKILLTKNKESFILILRRFDMKCCFCGTIIEGYGNNPAPLKERGKCCDTCNETLVIPIRMRASLDEVDKVLIEYFKGEE
jgi:hypothetical protein